MIWLVRTVRIGTILRLRTRKNSSALKSENIVLSVENIQPIRKLNRPVALTAEHPAPNRGVGGSNPSRPAKGYLKC